MAVMHAEPDFRQLFEAGPGLYLVLTPEFTIAAASDAYLQATMTRREQIVGRNLFDIFPDNPDDPSAAGERNLRTSLKRVLADKTVDAMAVQKYDIRKPESEGGGFEVRYWSPVNSPLLGPDGNVQYLIHSVQDVTEFVHARQHGTEQAALAESLRARTVMIEAEIYARAREVQDANRRIEQANQELARLYAAATEADALKTRFFSNVSHELRTPLTLILGPVDRLLERAAANDEQRQSLQLIKRSARSLLRHVNDLLDVSKLSAGQMTVHRSALDLAALTRLLGAHFETIAQDRHIRFGVHTPPQLRVITDAEKFERIVLNLLSNAFKFTPDGGAVVLGLSVQGDVVELIVQDSGPGVSPALRDAIFEPFRQAGDVHTRRYGGTGLGLAIAREFAQLLDGAIGVSDAEGGGALFRFCFPLVACAPEVEIAETVAAEPQSAVALSVEEFLHPLSRRDIARRAAAVADISLPPALVVEDNLDMHHFICASLAPHYRTVSAYTGHEGVDVAVSTPPDIVISDMMMPDMSGEELAQALRKLAEFDQVPIMLLTAKADDDLKVRLLRNGVQDFLTKPFLVEELLARMANLLAVSRARRILQQELASSEADVIELARDVAARKRALEAAIETLHQRDAALSQLNAQLEQRVVERTNQLAAAKDDLEVFSYSASHELRAPLRHLMGFARLLHERYSGQLDTTAQEFLTYIVDGGRRMGTLMDSLLELGRVRRAEVNWTPVDLRVVVEEVRSELRPDWEARAVEWDIAELPTVLGDPRLLKSVFHNLLSNALKYSRGREQARIGVGIAPQESGEHLWVSDNGVGFDARFAEKLFGVFRRLHSYDEFEGSGLGLATVQRIVEKHRGRVWAESRLGEGATFHFLLGRPLLDADETATPVRAQA